MKLEQIDGQLEIRVKVSRDDCLIYSSYFLLA